MRAHGAQGGRDAMHRALRYLASKDRTIHEVQAYLEGKGLSQASIREALTRLQEWGYLDDRRVALRWATDRLDRAHWGPARLFRELGRRGLESEAIEQVLKEVMAGTTEVDLAREAVNRYLRTHPRTEGPEGLRRLAGYLGRRGYSGEVVVRILRDLDHGWMDDGPKTP